jgi:hypothetical protein
MLSLVFPRHHYHRHESEDFPLPTALSYTVSLDPKVVDSMNGYGMV